MEDDSIYQDAGMYANKIREPKSKFLDSKLSIVGLVNFMLLDRMIEEG